MSGLFRFFTKSRPESPAFAPASSERRSPRRRTGTPVLVQLRDPIEPGQKLEGLVLDVSHGGLSLPLKQSIEVGAVLEPRVATAAGSVPWVQVEARHFSPVGTRWRAGCRFVPEPEPAVRVLVG